MKAFQTFISTSPDQRVNRFILISPFALIVIGQLVARMADSHLGTLAWAYLVVGYWISLAMIIFIGGGKKAIIRWMHPSQGGPLWPFLAIAFSVISTIWMVIPNWHFFTQVEILIPTLIFGLVNPCLEEGYWRGLLIDSAVGWPSWLAILYSSILFAINHLFIMIVVPAGRNPAVWGYQLIVGLLLGVVFIKTKSLRWPIASHAVINFLSMTIAMFMNVYVPDTPW